MNDILIYSPPPKKTPKKQCNILDQNIMQTQHVHLKYYAANIIFTKVIKKGHNSVKNCPIFYDALPNYCIMLYNSD